MGSSTRPFVVWTAAEATRRSSLLPFFPWPCSRRNRRLSSGARRRRCEAQRGGDGEGQEGWGGADDVDLMSGAGVTQLGPNFHIAGMSPCSINPSDHRLRCCLRRVEWGGREAKEMAANVRPLKHLKLDPTGRKGGTEPGEEGGPRALRRGGWSDRRAAGRRGSGLEATVHRLPIRFGPFFSSSRRLGAVQLGRSVRRIE